MARQSARLIAIGFSQKQSIPDSRTSMAKSLCVVLALAITARRGLVATPASSSR